MTRDDIIRIAREADLPIVWIDGKEMLRCSGLERFAALVAAAEREECAKVAERMLRHYTQTVTGVPEAIRKRSRT
jgi:hypothetical protein